MNELVGFSPDANRKLTQEGEACTNEVLFCLKQQQKEYGVATWIFDVDGVLLDEAVVDGMKPKSPEIISGLLALQRKGIRLGIATACNVSVVDYFKTFGIDFGNLAILEEGGHVNFKGKKYNLVDENHTKFIAMMKRDIQDSPLYRSDLAKVVLAEESGVRYTFTHPDTRWNGLTRTSLWQLYQESDDDSAIIQEHLVPRLQTIANRVNLTLGRDVIVKPYRTQRKNGNIVSWKYNAVRKVFEGQPMSKVIAMEAFLSNTPRIITTDGPNDLQWIDQTQNLDYSLGIHIGGSTDISSDIKTAEEISKHSLKDSTELARVMLAIAEKF